MEQLVFPAVTDTLLRESLNLSIRLSALSFFSPSPAILFLLCLPHSATTCRLWDEHFQLFYSATYFSTLKSFVCLILSLYLKISCVFVSFSGFDFSLCHVEEKFTLWVWFSSESVSSSLIANFGCAVRGVCLCLCVRALESSQAKTSHLSFDIHRAPNAHPPHTYTHTHPFWRHYFSFLTGWLMCLWAHTNSRVVNSCHCSFLQPLMLLQLLKLRGWVSLPW